MMVFRKVPNAGDVGAVRRIVESTSKFNAAEVAIAMELVTERLEKGEQSGYFFLFLDAGGETIGYACFGPVPATASSFDLYWIAVHQDHQGKKLGRRILEESEKAMAAMGAGNVYVETSGRPDYLPTRAFYLACGYVVEAVLKDYYAPADDKVILVKRVR